MKSSNISILLSSFLFAFYVQVKVPAGMSRTYDNVKNVQLMADGFVWRLVLENDKVVFTPVLFTVIEEK